MRIYALAALLALPLLGLVVAPQEASAQYRCCNERPYYSEPAPVRLYRVEATAVVFDRDSWENETGIRIKRGAVVHAQCRVGWCRVLSGQFKFAYVLERCLEPFYRNYREYDRDDSDRDRSDYRDRDRDYYRPRYRSYRQMYPGYDD